MLTLTYPTTVELEQIAQDKLPNLMTDRPIFEILPVRSVDNHILSWEQKDNYIGLQQFRGVGAQPHRVKRIGGKRLQMEPGMYGEFVTIDEQELLVRRPWGQLEGVISVDDLVMEAQDQLLGRRLDRIEKIGWDLLTTGTFSVAHPEGGTIHTDTFPVQTFTASVTWALANAATATPLQNFRDMQLLNRGHSVGFGPAAKAYMNQKTFNMMIANTNTADLYGRRTSGLGTINNAGDVSKLLAGDGLPQINIYDMGYLDDSGTFQPWIADNKVIVVGQRPGNQTVGEYRMTRNLISGTPGAYQRVEDKPKGIVPQVEVHDGHNGGPVIYFPSAIVIMNV